MRIDLLEFVERDPTLKIRSLKGARYLGLRRSRSDGAVRLGVRQPWTMKAAWIDVVDVTSLEVRGTVFEPDFDETAALDHAQQMQSFIEA